MNTTRKRGTLYMGMERWSAYRKPSRLSAHITPGEGAGKEGEGLRQSEISILFNGETEITNTKSNCISDKYTNKFNNYYI